MALTPDDVACDIYFGPLDADGHFAQRDTAIPEKLMARAAKGPEGGKAAASPEQQDDNREQRPRHAGTDRRAKRRRQGHVDFLLPIASRRR